MPGSKKLLAEKFGILECACEKRTAARIKVVADICEERVEVWN